jgi:hypothetical protein
MGRVPMTQLTVRGVDEQLLRALKERASQRGISVNRLVLDTLRQMEGLGPNRNTQQRYHDLDYLVGTWSDEEYEEFQTALAQQRQIEMR